MSDSEDEAHGNEQLTQSRLFQRLLAECGSIHEYWMLTGFARRLGMIYETRVIEVLRSRRPRDLPVGDPLEAGSANDIAELLVAWIQYFGIGHIAVTRRGEFIRQQRAIARTILDTLCLGRDQRGTRVTYDVLQGMMSLDRIRALSKSIGAQPQKQALERVIAHLERMGGAVDGHLAPMKAAIAFYAKHFTMLPPTAALLSDTQLPRYLQTGKAPAIEDLIAHAHTPVDYAHLIALARRFHKHGSSRVRKAIQRGLQESMITPYFDAAATPRQLQQFVEGLWLLSATPTPEQRVTALRAVHAVCGALAFRADNGGAAVTFRAILTHMDLPSMQGLLEDDALPETIRQRIRLYLDTVPDANFAIVGDAEVLPSAMDQHNSNVAGVRQVLSACAGGRYSAAVPSTGTLGGLQWFNPKRMLNWLNS